MHEGRVAADVQVVPVEGWERPIAALTGTRPWVPPSPAMPSAHTAALYPGTGLVEGFTLSDGRGTALPFRVVGAPWVDAPTLWRALRRRGLPGVAASPYGFTPTDGRYAGQPCGGVLLTVVDPAELRPVAAGVALISTIAQLWPEHLTEAPYPTRANPSGTHHADLLLGVADAADRIRRGDVETAVPGWPAHVQAALLY